MTKSNNRLTKEIARLAEKPPEGISCYPQNDNKNLMTVYIIGPHHSPYEGGAFQLDLQIDTNYPFEPPRLKFITKVYHPNIDTSGRICLDLLQMPPKGGWKPTITLENLLVAVQMLLRSPNPNDPLMPDIASEFKFNKLEFEKKAKLFTEKYAKHTRQY